MNVLYISYDGMTDPLGQSQVIPYLIGLSKRGFRITLLSCEKKAKYNLHKEHINIMLSQNKIDWAPITFYSSPKFISSYLNVKNLKKKALEICDARGIKLIHARSYIAAQAALHAQSKLKVKFLFDMRGFWVDERIDGNIWQKSNLIHRLLFSMYKNHNGSKSFF